MHPSRRLAPKPYTMFYKQAFSALSHISRSMRGVVGPLLLSPLTRHLSPSVILEPSSPPSQQRTHKRTHKRTRNRRTQRRIHKRRTQKTCTKDVHTKKKLNEPCFRGKASGPTLLTRRDHGSTPRGNQNLHPTYAIVMPTDLQRKKGKEKTKRTGKARFSAKPRHRLSPDYSADMPPHSAPTSFQRDTSSTHHPTVVQSLPKYSVSSWVNPTKCII